MRTLGVFALVFTAGCSLLWDMSPYEGGTGAGANDGGASSGASSGGASSGTSTSGGSSGGSSGASGDGDASILEGGTSSGDSGTDAGQLPCMRTEAEPNEDESEATGVPSGKICGTISSFGDDDWFEVDVAGSPITITIELGVNVRVQVEYATGGTGISTTPGVKSVPMPPGSNLLHFASLSGNTGAYAIIRP